MKLLALLISVSCLTIAVANRASFGGEVASLHEVAEVDFVGDFKIKESILRNEIELRPGSNFSKDEWIRDRKRIASLGVFSEVSSDTARTPEGIKVNYRLKEMWTLIPFLSIGGELDNIDIDIGLKDKDFLGLYIEPGVMFSRFESRNSYSAWLNWPRVLQTKFSVGVAYSNAHSREPAYVRSETYLHHYDVKRVSISGTISKRLSEVFVAGVGVTYRTQRFRLEESELPVVSLLDRRNDRRFRPSAFFSVGRIYYDDYFYEGADLTAIGDIIAIDRHDYEPKYWMLKLELRSYLVQMNRLNFCSRAFFGTSKTDDILPVFAVSGFSNIRGTDDRYRRGSKIYYINNELRVRAYQDRFFHGQLTAFVDAGDAWDDKLSLSELVEESYLTGGIGLRVAFRRFYSAIGRADLAYNTNNGEWTLYFSAGQFF